MESTDQDRLLSTYTANTDYHDFMHVLFVHQNFPAQFGQVAAWWAQTRGGRSTFVSSKSPATIPGVEHIQYPIAGGARESNHFCSRTFENQIWNTAGLYQALKQRPDIQPDLIVAHSGFVSSLFLRELYPQTPHLGYFEFFYHPRGSDMDFRSDLPQLPPASLLRARARNAQLLLDLHNCDAGYSPTQFQRSQMPAEYQSKLHTIFDGIDTKFWSRQTSGPRTICGLTFPAGSRFVTYVSRGFESIRGFDIFLQVADKICRARPDTHVLVVGEDRICYGGDDAFTEGKSFKQWAIDKYQPDLTRIHFLGRVAPSDLVHIFSISDLHMYLTGPFVLSWSLFNAMSCGCTVLASDTAPVRELVESGETGLLADFFDVDGLTHAALKVLADPGEFTYLGRQGRYQIETNYRLEVCLTRMEELFRQVVGSQ